MLSFVRPEQARRWAERRRRRRGLLGSLGIGAGPSRGPNSAKIRARGGDAGAARPAGRFRVRHALEGRAGACARPPRGGIARGVGDGTALGLGTGPVGGPSGGRFRTEPGPRGGRRRRAPRRALPDAPRSRGAGRDLPRLLARRMARGRADGRAPTPPPGAPRGRPKRLRRVRGAPVRRAPPPRAAWGPDGRAALPTRGGRLDQAPREAAAAVARRRPGAAPPPRGPRGAPLDAFQMYHCTSTSCTTVYCTSAQLQRPARARPPAPGCRAAPAGCGLKPREGAGRARAALRARGK